MASYTDSEVSFIVKCSRSSFHNENGPRPNAVLYLRGDFSKAFDKVYHHYLLYKLDCTGIDPRVKICIQ